MLSPAQKRYAVWRARIRISNHIQQRLSSKTGAFAAAVLTDDRTGLNALTVQILRYLNLAHLLAISGLHMGLFTGFFFALLRLALICLPEPIRYGPTKQIAACGESLPVRLIWRCRAAMWSPKGFLLWRWWRLRRCCLKSAF
jgi:competence protein ComEC